MNGCGIGQARFDLYRVMTYNMNDIRSQFDIVPTINNSKMKRKKNKNTLFHCTKSRVAYYIVRRSDVRSNCLLQKMSFAGPPTQGESGADTFLRSACNCYP